MYMQQPMPVPLQPDLFAVRTKKHAVILRLQEGNARLVDCVPLTSDTWPDLYPRIVRCYVTPGRYRQILVAGALPELGSLPAPVVHVPARALLDAFRFLQTSPFLV